MTNIQLERRKYIDNIIDLPRQLGRVIPSASESYGGGGAYEYI